LLSFFYLNTYSTAVRLKAVTGFVVEYFVSLVFDAPLESLIFNGLLPFGGRVVIILVVVSDGRLERIDRVTLLK
jgi:hypothetical protein